MVLSPDIRVPEDGKPIVESTVMTVPPGLTELIAVTFG